MRWMLLFGTLDKPTRVDDDDARVVRFDSCSTSPIGGLAHQDFGVIDVLGASRGHHIPLRGFVVRVLMV